MCEPEYDTLLNQTTVDGVLLLINTASAYLFAPTDSTRADFIEQLQIVVGYIGDGGAGEEEEA
jgi:hypothetical protein